MVMGIAALEGYGGSNGRTMDAWDKVRCAARFSLGSLTSRSSRRAVGEMLAERCEQQRAARRSRSGLADPPLRSSPSPHRTGLPNRRPLDRPHRHVHDQALLRRLCRRPGARAPLEGPPAGLGRPAQVHPRRARGVREGRRGPEGECVAARAPLLSSPLLSSRCRPGPAGRLHERRADSKVWTCAQRSSYSPTRSTSRGASSSSRRPTRLGSGARLASGRTSRTVRCPFSLSTSSQLCAAVPLPPDVHHPPTSPLPRSRSLGPSLPPSRPPLALSLPPSPSPSPPSLTPKAPSLTPPRPRAQTSAASSTRSCRTSRAQGPCAPRARAARRCVALSSSSSSSLSGPLSPGRARGADSRVVTVDAAQHGHQGAAALLSSCPSLKLNSSP